MSPGITIIEETIGSGDEATKKKTVLVSVRMLPLDDKDISNPSYAWNTMKINLARRDASPGLRYGVEGMRAGGRRIFIISSSLSGCNAPLRVEVVLQEVRDGPYLTPEEYPPGKAVQINHPGEMSRLLPKWNFGLGESGNYQISITVPIPGLKWKHSRAKETNGNMDASKTADLVAWIMNFPMKYPDQIVSDVITYGGDSSWYADISETVVCIHVGIWERGQYSCSYYVPETSLEWHESELQHFINALIKPRPAASSGPARFA